MPVTTDINDIWTQVLDILKGDLNEPTFKTWFEHTVAVELTDDGQFVVGVANDFARTWIEDRWTPLLNSVMKQVIGLDVSVVFVVDGLAGNAVEESAASNGRYDDIVLETRTEVAPVATDPTDDSEPAHLDPRFTFDTFVVGESNDFARNAALAVAEQPGIKYNPLFIWGGPGLGKTHLLQAIGNYVTENYPHKKVMFVTSETFTNDFVESISAKTTESFRRKYRSVDVLLIDDIQFVAKKQGTLDSFFHTFNELRQRGKAVVLASDRPPKDLQVDERYSSRLASGLPADIQPPTYETRLAILKQFVSTRNVPFEDDALAFVAERSSPNIREMEGAINRIMAFRDLSKKPVVDLKMAEQVTRDMFPDHNSRPIPISSIQREVCRFYGVSHAEIIGSKRTQSIVYPRHVAMYLSQELTDLSLPKIGQEFGGRDHTTVMHAREKIQKLMASQRDVYNQVQQLTSTIRQRN